MDITRHRECIVRSVAGRGIGGNDVDIAISNDFAVRHTVVCRIQVCLSE